MISSLLWPWTSSQSKPGHSNHINSEDQTSHSRFLYFWGVALLRLMASPDLFRCMPYVSFCAGFLIIRELGDGGSLGGCWLFSFRSLHCLSVYQDQIWRAGMSKIQCGVWFIPFCRLRSWSVTISWNLAWDVLCMCVSWNLAERHRSPELETVLITLAPYQLHAASHHLRGDTQLRGCPYQFGLWACLWEVILSIDVGESHLPWAVPPLGEVWET